MVGNDSTPAPRCTNVGRQRLASNTLHLVAAVGSGQRRQSIVQIRQKIRYCCCERGEIHYLGG